MFDWDAFFKVEHKQKCTESRLFAEETQETVYVSTGQRTKLKQKSYLLHCKKNKTESLAKISRGIEVIQQETH